MAQYSVESLAATIRDAPTVEELAAVRERFLEDARDRAFVFSPEPIVELQAINDVHDGIITRAVRLVEQAMTLRGDGAPPAAYEFLLFGSGGRREQTLWSDQDNGIVYDDRGGASTAESVRAYFLEFGRRVSEALKRVGYPPCEGGVLSGNERWCRSVGDWERTVAEWYAEPTWEHMRYLLITADLRTLSYASVLTGRIRNAIMSYPPHNRSVAERLLGNTLRHKVLVGLFGQLLKEQYGENAGAIDIKYGAYIPLINGVRLLALLHGVAGVSTLDRLAGLDRRGAIPSPAARSWQEAHRFFTRLRLASSHRREHGVWMSSGTVKLDRLSKQDVHELKRHLKAGKSLQRFVKLSVERYQE